MAKSPLPARLLAAWARLLEARGNTAGARARAEAALQAEPGRCDILQFLADLSRRSGSLSDQDRFIPALLSCSDGVQSAAQLARDAGRLQQQQANSGGQQGAASQAPAASSIQAQAGAGMMSGAQGGQAQTDTDAGEQGGVGAGTGTTDGVGDPAGRLSTAGQVVET